MAKKLAAVVPQLNLIFMWRWEQSSKGQNKVMKVMIAPLLIFYHNPSPTNDDFHVEF